MAIRGWRSLGTFDRCCGYYMYVLVCVRLLCACMCASICVRNKCTQGTWIHYAYLFLFYFVRCKRNSNAPFPCTIWSEINFAAHELYLVFPFRLTRFKPLHLIFVDRNCPSLQTPSFSFSFSFSIFGFIVRFYYLHNKNTHNIAIAITPLSSQKQQQFNVYSGLHFLLHSGVLRNAHF